MEVKKYILDYGYRRLNACKKLGCKKYTIDNSNKQKNIPIFKNKKL